MNFETNFKIKPGDLVRIRSWEDMVEEYGYNVANGYINTPGYVFSTPMQRYCGKQFTFTSGYSEGGAFIVRGHRIRRFKITLSMIEPVCLEPELNEDTSTIANYLEGFIKR